MGGHAGGRRGCLQRLSYASRAWGFGRGPLPRCPGGVLLPLLLGEPPPHTVLPPHCRAAPRKAWGRSAPPGLSWDVPECSKCGWGSPALPRFPPSPLPSVSSPSAAAHGLTAPRTPSSAGDSGAAAARTARPQIPLGSSKWFSFPREADRRCPLLRDKSLQEGCREATADPAGWEAGALQPSSGVLSTGGTGVLRPSPQMSCAGPRPTRVKSNEN